MKLEQTTTQQTRKMKNIKLATLLMAAAVPGAMTFGKIALTDTLSVKGFIDSSYSYQDID